MIYQHKGHCTQLVQRRTYSQHHGNHHGNKSILHHFIAICLIFSSTSKAENPPKMYKIWC